MTESLESKGYGKCELFVLGMSVKCPLCAELVESGEHHVCEYGAPAMLAFLNSGKKKRPTKA